MRAAVKPARGCAPPCDQLYPTIVRTGAAQGGMCAALANVEEDNWEWRTFDTIKGGDYLADQDAVEIMCKEGHRRRPRPREEGMPVQPGPSRPHRPTAVRRAPATTARPRCAGPVAADRTSPRSRPADAVPNCVKHDVEFFNEFYAPRPGAD